MPHSKHARTDCCDTTPLGRRSLWWGLIPFLGLATLMPAAPLALAVEPCRIEVVDRENGWPVPLVELKTTHEMRFVTDNAGVVAIDAPELLSREVWFTVNGYGYRVPPDGFGNAGVRLQLEPGATFRVEVERTIIARRLGRLTGGGLLAESQKLGDYLDFSESGVFGCDSVQMAVHRGRCFWLWGDTALPRYPLGIFDSTAATSKRYPLQALKPPVHMPYEYFRDADGAIRGVAPIPGAGPTWLTGMVSLPDKQGTPHLVAVYRKITPPLETNEAGLCVWDEENQQFVKHTSLWKKTDNEPHAPLLPEGHAAFWNKGAREQFVLFGNPFPRVRMVATFEAWRDPDAWEELRPQPWLPTADGQQIHPHSGSIAYSDYRQRWVTVFMQQFGKPSAFGELWYAEANAPTGPWGPAVKILSHDNYTFYNPRVHLELSPPNSPFLLFEGTYTEMFADRPLPTPRYNYNQILYRLDLDDPRLAPAQQGEPSQAEGTSGSEQ